MTEFSPQWSIVVPTFGRGALLPALMTALVALNRPAGGFEIVLVDDGSPAPLDDVIAPFRPQADIRLIRKPNGGPASARNVGVRQARGCHIALTDDDCRPGRDWLVALERGLNADPDALIGGRTHNGLTDNLYSDTSQLLVDYLYACDDGRDQGATFLASNNMAFSRALFRTIGGFDESFPLAAGEDREFCDRWRATGHPIRFAPAAVVDHYHALSARGFWRQHRNYGRGAARVHARRAAANSEQSRFERLSFYARLVTYPLAAGSPAPLRQSLLMAVSQAATTAGYVRELAARRGER